MLKCALHTHTTLSDGNLHPEEVIQLYYNSGYRVISITDHDRCYDGPTEHKDMLIIPGIERTEGRCHVVEFGGIRILAHPKWSGLSEDDFTNKMTSCQAYEAFNTVCRQRSSRWRPELSMWPGQGIAVDDFHWATWKLRDIGLTNFFGLGQTWIDTEPTIEAVCSAIVSGIYRTSIE